MSTSNRHETIVRIAEALRARVDTLCTAFASVTARQTTDRKVLVDLIVASQDLPAAVVLLGPFDYEDGIHPGERLRTLNPGVLVTTEYDADPDAGGGELWALLDALDLCFMPLAARGDNPGKPIAVLGDQSGASRGIWVVPAGWNPIDAGDDRAAGVYNLMCWDPVMTRTD